ncbi:WD40-repeat-containing domain protein [Halteromyces radiatus]|uniref:WD40-repeat-containing domain protein n=1 Tax=Halteromyces radiatus TaxID=101107 RepID=UPI00221FBE75|nr:WD40-repeat-containing domain protein [Halteromyces radiatus]KAI8078908.1 WD40-repeat-containing domain protein [Halteromyces radiatus]
MSLYLKKQTPSVAQPIPVVQNNGNFTYNDRQIVHQVETTIQHWQLRNLISSPSSHIVALPRHNTIQFYNTKTKEIVKTLDLPFAPMSIDTRYDHVAVAGPRGLALVRSMDDSWSSDVFNIGPGMNNAIGLSKIDQDVRVTICNNDHTIHIYSIPSMKRITVLELPSAVNHTSVSMDGKFMLATSDTGDVYQYSIHGDQYELESTYKVSNEPCLGCAWNSSSTMFAVTSQDGQVNVFDVVTQKKLCQLVSSETRKTRKAARCVAFSKGPLDLMIYSEHVSQVNIVDTRTFDRRQIIRLAPLDMDAHIAGITFSPDYRSIFVALEDNLTELKLDLASRRQFPSATPLSIF